MSTRAPGVYLAPRRVLRVSLMVLVLACAGLVAGLGHHAPVAHASGGCCLHYVHIASAANSGGDWTRIDDTRCYDNGGCVKGNSTARLLVTPNWNPGGAVFGVYDNHPIGVWYDGTFWNIFNQDRTPIPLGAAFNVYVLDGFPFDGDLVQTATSGNSRGNVTCIDDPNLNGNPSAQMTVTPNWNPGGVGGVYENHPIGVYYDSVLFRGRWCIFNQDGAAMPSGAAFNVEYSPSVSGGSFLQTATSANSTDDYTVMNTPSLNNLPNITLWVTPNWNPGGVGGVYDNHNLGVFYNLSLGRWCIFNQDGSAIPTGAAFNVFYH